MAVLKGGDSLKRPLTVRTHVQKHTEITTVDWPPSLARAQSLMLWILDIATCLCEEWVRVVWEEGPCGCVKRLWPLYATSPSEV